jgi:hypothetical protein
VRPHESKYPEVAPIAAETAEMSGMLLMLTCQSMKPEDEFFRHGCFQSSGNMPCVHQNLYVILTTESIFYRHLQLRAEPATTRRCLASVLSDSILFLQGPESQILAELSAF